MVMYDLSKLQNMNVVSVRKNKVKTKTRKNETTVFYLFHKNREKMDGLIVVLLKTVESKKIIVSFTDIKKKMVWKNITQINIV